MKKAFLLLLLFGTAHAQLNLEWGSYITLEHPAVGDQLQTNDQFGTRFGSVLDSINDELVIGAPNYDIGNANEAGRIYYLKAAPNNAIRPLEWVSGNGRYSQSSISGATPESVDLFAKSVSIIATASNASKVLIGVPLEDIGNLTDAGMAHEMFIDSMGVDFLNYHQDTSGVQGTAEPGDDMGRSVAWGDFDNDGNWDAAIGAPGESVLGNNNAGAVNVIMGDNDGILDPGDDQIWDQSSLFIEGSPSTDEQFGWVLAVGDFDDDGRSDLAIGVPGDDVDGVDKAGSVNVIYGGGDGLGATGDQIWNQNTDGIGGGAEPDDQFGYALEVGDFNGDGVDDLAIGIPFEDIGDEENAGAVQIIYGEDDEGLVATGSLFISQAESGFLGASEAGDLFGFSLASGRLNGDHYDDLSIGTPRESFTDAYQAGAAYVVHGSSGGLQFNNEYVISEAYFSVPGGRRASRQFGYAQTSSDFDNDGKDDLAISAWPRYQSTNNYGTVIVAYRVNHDFIFSNGFD